ncbi:hypothetical protein BLNAU_19997 [Blattamonas nauphoetae]|uniref:DUF659 domain-containing protein n=1 Tax=Blattamonas nauphoetae TaxID=2049346 RepID=A0ABQ9X027_9EUKA|nr:hypothetical protein BLNAU_19997 [Blattamonas nauphoetae]
MHTPPELIFPRMTRQKISIGMRQRSEELREELVHWIGGRMVCLCVDGARVGNRDFNIYIVHDTHHENSATFYAAREEGKTRDELSTNIAAVVEEIRGCGGEVASIVTDGFVGFVRALGAHSSHEVPHLASHLSNRQILPFRYPCAAHLTNNAFGDWIRAHRLLTDMSELAKQVCHEAKLRGNRALFSTHPPTFVDTRWISISPQLMWIARNSHVLVQNNICNFTQDNSTKFRFFAELVLPVDTLVTQLESDSMTAGMVFPMAIQCVHALVV